MIISMYLTLSVIIEIVPSKLFFVLKTLITFITLH